MDLSNTLSKGNESISTNRIQLRNTFPHQDGISKYIWITFSTLISTWEICQRKRKIIL